MIACWYSPLTNSVSALKYSLPNSSFKNSFHDGSIFTSTSSRDSCHREVVLEFMRTLYQASSSPSFCAGLERPETIVYSCHSYDFVNKWLLKLGLDSENYSRYAP